MQHKFFRNMVYNFKASSNKMLIVNTTKLDNDIFYGRVIGDVNFNFTGPESNMKMYISGRPVDSSRMVIQTESDSKRSGEVDYIVWRQYGREMNTDSLERDNTNLLIDLDLTANNYLRMTVVLDENTGDSITATGSGNLKILTGTKEAMVMNGRYNIERGNYNFNFQDIFNKIVLKYDYHANGHRIKRFSHILEDLYDAPSSFPPAERENVSQVVKDLLSSTDIASILLQRFRIVQKDGSFTFNPLTKSLSVRSCV